MELYSRAYMHFILDLFKFVQTEILAVSYFDAYIPSNQLTDPCFPDEGDGRTRWCSGCSVDVYSGAERL
jgi:hypothetical protein